MSNETQQIFRGALGRLLACSSYCGHWWKELVSITFSLGCAGAVVAILYAMDNEPIDHWNFYFKLNSTIAFFISATKFSSMIVVAECISQWKWLYFRREPRPLKDLDIIDEASRGPKGSVIMIWRGPWGTVTLGALITILALFADWFAQQVLRIDEVQTRWINDEKATFGLAHSYVSGAQESADGMLGAPVPFTEDTAMQGAIFRAIYNLTAPAQFGCPTNCTWNQNHVSLGFSTTCQDVTKETYSTRNCSGTDASRSNPAVNCTMTTPGGVTFSTLELPTDWSTAVVVQAKPSLNLTDTGRMSPEFVRLAAFRQPTSYYGVVGETMPNQTIDCGISFAAYKYSNAYSQSNQFSIGFTEKIALEWAYTRGGRLLDGNVRAPEGNITFNTSGLPEFTISTADIGVLLYFFGSSSFSGMLLEGESVPSYSEGITTALADPSSNITAILENTAGSMTDELRSRYSATAYGLTATTVVLARVEWAWLALPVFVVLASAVVLVAAIFDSREVPDMPVWKSTSTAFLHPNVLPDGAISTKFIRADEPENGVNRMRLNLE